MSVLFFVLGLVLMIIGAEFLVRGASRLALMLGISPLVVGLTVVAFGTSAPEFAVSFKAALDDQASLCVGNVIGSNIFNLLFVIGISAVVVPLIVSPQLIRVDLPLVIAVSVLTLILGFDLKFSRIDGILLFSGLILYNGSLIYINRKRPQKDQNGLVDVEPLAATAGNKLYRSGINLGLMVIGLTMLVVGANWLVETAVSLARWLQVSELIIGLTIVSIGTSLPEVVTSIVASMKGERDIAVGNVIGSNLFNLLGVLGLTAIIAPSGLSINPQAIEFDMPVMIAVAAIAFPIFFTGKLIARWEGAVLLGYYGIYTLYLILSATNDPRIDTFGKAVLYVAVPLTVVAFLITSIRQLRSDPVT